MLEITAPIHVKIRGYPRWIGVTRVVRAGPYPDLRMKELIELPASRLQIRPRAEVNDLRELLEANLATLHSLVQIQARKLKSLEQTRALLYVALKELIVQNDNG